MSSAARYAWELSRTVLNDRDGWIIVLKAYLDEPGTHDGAPALTVAGYFGRPKVWKEFVRDWRTVLRTKGIDCFHSNQCQALRGEFEGWSPGDRDAFVAKLLAVIPRHDVVGIAIGIVMPDYAAALAKRSDLLPIMGNPYGTCFQWLAQSMMDLAQRYCSREAMALIHEANDMQGEAFKAFDWLRSHRDWNKNLHSLTFVDKDRFVPLQAADILAYEAGKLIRNPDGRRRRSFDAISPKGKEPYIRFYDKSNMHKMISLLDGALARANAGGPFA